MQVIDGLPDTSKTPQKAILLDNVLRKKTLAAFGPILSLYISKSGFAFVELENESKAKAAIRKLDKSNLDVSHKLSAFPWSEFQRVQNVSEKFTPPKVEPYPKKDNLKEWLLDSRGLDQFALRYGDVTEICWNDLKSDKDPERVEAREVTPFSFVSHIL